ncbi:glucose 1-dehydrogenase [Ferroplasma acidiphilum]|uniref:Glucose 1-dehydrogenase n=1 Tax=Ferroplasma acidiphilum TaxID=74969 RepID=A0A7K4FQN7_9ARCH|nr:glucose 1-dehydrogenase [Ferroplasma acidiphilum]NOL60437.1 glucose 1-dehydrogenase [Ferroplasma acidiphilum]
MQAITVKPPEAGITLQNVDYKNNGIKIKILENGICGTDREIVKGQLNSAAIPAGSNYLILGHEAIGTVMEDGTIFKKGDIVMPVNRRGCGKCLNCMVGRPDFCETGNFVEAGIKGMQGFMGEYIYDDEKYLVRVPAGIKNMAILAQPLADLEKSMDEIINIQKRMIWRCSDNTFHCRNALVIGTGTIGILFSLLLKTYGFSVTIANRRYAHEKEVKIFNMSDIKYYNSATGYKFDNNSFDLIIEASGSSADVISQTMGFLKNNGIFGLFGFIRSGELSINSHMLQDFVYKSIAMVGLINGQKPHFEMAMDHLMQWQYMYPGIDKLLITNEIKISDREKITTALTEKSKDEIKTRILWD